MEPFQNLYGSIAILLNKFRTMIIKGYMGLR